MAAVNNKVEEIRLTQLSHGAGCGCKISPEILEGMIKEKSGISNPLLLEPTQLVIHQNYFDISAYFLYL